MARGGIASGQSAWRVFEKELREVGFGREEIQGAWSRRDDIERVSIELMALAAGLVLVEDLASDTVSRARQTLAYITQMPFEDVEGTALRLSGGSEALSGGRFAHRHSAPIGVSVALLVDDCEQKLGWSDYPPGNAGRAARIIVRREIYYAVQRTYPQLGDECRRQFTKDWNQWRCSKGALRGFAAYRR
jgi:hypothetical protein